MADKISKNVYGYKFAVSFLLDNKETKINENQVKAIIINRDYLNKNMPTIYMTLFVKSDLYTTIINNKSKGFIKLKISKYSLSNRDSKSDYINLKFNYLCNIDKSMLINEDKANMDDYHSLNLGLYLQSIVDQNKKTVINGVFKNNNTASIISYYTSHIKNMIIEKFDNNRNITSLIIPPIDSISNLLSFLNQIEGFYNTEYLFFMDYDYTYLISTAGNDIDAKDNTYNNILINVIDDDIPQQDSGMIINSSKKLYSFDVSHTSMDITENDVGANTFNILSGVSTDGFIKNAKSSSIKNSNSESKSKYIRIYNDNLTYIEQLKNKADSKQIIINISKPALDCSLFTPNKKYTIKSSNSKINGKYMLISKKELFGASDKSTPTAIVTLTLEKIS